MPRGRPKGSKNLSAYERMKVKKVRESLAKNGITDFDKHRDAQILHNIYINTDGEIFAKYEISKHSIAITSVRKNIRGAKLLNKVEKTLATLWDTI